MSKEVIRIDRYNAEIEHGKIVYYALQGKKKYSMPDCYKEMYDDQHLAIMEKTVSMPDLLGLPADQATHYMPISTVPPVVNKPTPIKG